LTVDHRNLSKLSQGFSITDPILLGESLHNDEDDEPCHPAPRYPQI